MTPVVVFHEQNTCSFATLDADIEDDFLGIDRFEFQLAEKLRTMRDSRIFLEGGYKSFEQYCEQRLSRWGGHRRVNQLIGAAIVVETLKDTEFDGVIKRESHARPLLRLVKNPEKLKEAVALACEQSRTPIAANFKQAVEAVEPKPQRTKVSEVAPLGETPRPHFSQEQLFLKGTKVKISSLNHLRHGQECVIAADAPNNSQQIVEFEDGERVTVHNDDLDAPSSPYTPVERRYPKEYEEAIAQLKLQHQQEIERLEADIKVRLQVEAEEKAIASLHDQLKAAQDLASAKALEAAKLQRQLVELEGLRRLEEENQRLNKEIEHLKESMRLHSESRWENNTVTPEAAKVINARVEKMVEDLDPDLHLKVLATTPPSRDRYNEVAELIEKAADLLEVVPRIGRRVEYQGHFGTLEDVEGATAVVDWDERNEAGERIPLTKLNVLPTIEGVSKGSFVGWADTNHPAYHYKGEVLQAHPRTKEATVRWHETGKTKTYPISALRLIRGIAGRTTA